MDCDRTEYFYSLNDELDTARQSAVTSTTQDINKVGVYSESTVIVIFTMFQIIDEESSPGVGRGSGLRRASGQRKDNR